MRQITRQLHWRRSLIAVMIGAFLALGPFLFWRTFLRQLPLTGTGSATLSERFEESNGMTDTSPMPQPQPRLRELLPHAANSLSVDRSSGMIRMYEEGTGRAFEVDPKTLQVTSLSEAHLESFRRTLWSPNGVEVVTLFQEPDGSRFRYYDYRTARVAPLPVNVRELAFSRTGDRIVTSRESQNGTEIWISKPDGSESWRLLVTRLRIAQIYWPHEDMIVIRTLRRDDREDLVAFDMEGKLTHLLEGYPELEIRWAPSGVHALVSYTTDEHELVLAVLNAREHSIGKLPLSTRAKKCAWHRGSSRITCGSAAQTTSASKDTVTSLDLGTGELTVRYAPSDDIWVAVTEPSILPQGSGMAFINAFDKRPYLVSW